MLKRGYLSWNSGTQRIRVRFDDGDDIDLHCGMTMDALVDGKWTPTRIEFRAEWYLVGLFHEDGIPAGLKIRMDI